MSERLTGHVMLWFPPKGYGFFLAPDGRRVFVHVTDTPERQNLPIGTRVTFTLGRDGRGRVKAVDIALRGRRPGARMCDK